MQSGDSLNKKMGFWQIWALGVGAVVGDGIFLMVASGAEQAGPSCVIAYAIAGLMLMCVCMNATELAVGMPVAGSMHDWSKRVLGPRWGVFAAFGNIAMDVVFLGSVGLGTGYISNYFFMWTDNADVSAVIWGIGLLAVVFVVTLLGGDVTGKTQLGLIIVLVGIMVVFTVAGILTGNVDRSNYSPFAPFGAKGVILAICAGTYAYMGPLSLLAAAGEVKNVKIMPKAMFWAFVTIILLYAAAILVCLGLVNYKEYSTMASPFTIAAQYVFGNAAGMVLNVAAWIACVTCLIGEIFAVSRLLYGMSFHGVVPKAFGKVNKRGVPHVGLTVAFVIGVLLLLMGIVPQFENAYTMLANVACACGIVCLIITVIASYAYKKKFPEEYAALPWKLKGKTFFFIIALIGCGVLFYSSFISSLETAICVIVFFVILMLFYQFYAKPNAAKMEREKEQAENGKSEE